MSSTATATKVTKPIKASLHENDGSKILDIELYRLDSPSVIVWRDRLFTRQGETRSSDVLPGYGNPRYAPASVSTINWYPSEEGTLWHDRYQG